MKLLVDEDLASRELIRRLREEFGDANVLAPEYGVADEQVWQRAQTERAAILTGNVVDFLRLAERHPDHHGLLLVYRSNDRAKDLRARDVADAVMAAGHSYANDLNRKIVVLNDFAKGPAQP